MRNTFRKSERLCSQTLIDWLFDGQTSACSAYPFRIVWKTREATGTEPAALPQLLISVPKKKFHHAVDRVHVKRLVREAYRTHKQPLAEAAASSRCELFVAIIWVGRELVPYTEVERRVQEALERIAKSLIHHE